MLDAVLQSHQMDESALPPLQERFRDYDVSELKVGGVLDYLTEETHLLYKDETVTSFPIKFTGISYLHFGSRGKQI